MDSIEFNKKNYWSWVLDQPCAHCNLYGSDGHNRIVIAHMELGYGLMGSKVHWTRVLPLHYFCHEDLHQRGAKTFWAMPSDSDLYTFISFRIFENIERFIIETTL